METNHLSECTFFQWNKRLIPFFILVDNGEGLDLRLADLNKNGLCIVDNVKALAELITKRTDRKDFKEQKQEHKLKAIKEMVKDRAYYPSPEQAYQAAKEQTIDYEELNLMYNQLNVLL